MIKIRFFGSMRTSFLMLLASLTVLVLSISHVHASLVTYQFEGELIRVDSELSSEFSVGDTFKMAYTFDTSIPAERQGSDVLEYSDVISAMSFASGKYTASGTRGSVFVGFNEPDTYQAFFIPLSGDTRGGFSPLVMLLDMSLEESFDIEDFGNFLPEDANFFTPEQFGQFTLVFEENTGSIRPADFIITGDISSVTVVPIPAAVWLFCTGLMGLIGFTKRKKMS
jgi:hypothetical protein